SRPQEIERARAELAQFEAALVLARREFVRTAELVERRALSQSAYDDAKAAVDEAEARVRAAQARFDLALAGPRVEEKVLATAELAAAEASAQQAETALADTELRAPDAGIIRTRIREPGAIVDAGAPVYTLALVEPVRIRAYVDEPDLGRIAPGQRVEVVSDSRPDTPYSGRIGFVSPTAEFTPRTVQTPELRTDLVYRFHVVVEDAEGLRQGMPVTVRVPEVPE
ncbi:MAG: efflux RND transporter periplasmic adaptor subunit, partial [Pseudomonadota bacterium]